MKTLTVKQPWAALIVHGIKDIENRTWQTKFRGRILIHAGVSSSGLPSDILTREQHHESMGVIGLKKDKSAIIGSVEIVDCVINHPSIWAEKTPDCALIGCSKCSITGYCGDTGLHLVTEPFKPIYNWVLANHILFDKPIIDVKGKLSLWEYSGNLPGLC